MTGQYNAGHAYLQIMPSFRGIDRLMQQETRKLAAEIDKSIAKGANDGLIRAFGNIDPNKVARSAGKSGDKWSSSFEAQLSKRMKEVADAIPAIDLGDKVKANRFERAITASKKALAELANQKIGPDGDVGLDAIGDKVESIIQRMVRLGDETKNLNQRMRLLGVAGQAEGIKSLIDDARAQGLTDGRVFGGAFAAQARAAITRGLRDLPEVNVDADASPAERAVAALRTQLAELGEKEIGVDIDRDRFAEEFEYITGKLESLTREKHTIALDYDLDSASKSLRQFADRIRPELTDGLDGDGQEAGERWAGAFSDTVNRRLNEAIRKIPNIPMTVDNSDAERQLAAIRVEMESLADKRIGVDVDAGAAQAQIAVLHERLNALDNDDIDIDVRVNAGSAAAELALISAASKDSSQSMDEFARDTGITMSRLGYLIAIGASLGSIVVPAAAAAAVAVAGIGTAASGAAIGLGVFALGFVGVVDAVKKIDAYNLDAAKSAKSLAQANNQVQNALESEQNAEQNLSRAREDGARAARDAAERVQDAQRSLARTQRDVADAIQRAREAEVEAIAAVAQARKDARERVQAAVETEKDAERALTRANEDQTEARQELNQALKDAVRDLAELDTAVKRNSLEIDQATTESMKAKEALDKIMTNPRATEIERRMALEAYRDRLLQIEELKEKGAELKNQQEQAAKSGVESTDRVKKAREKLATADERVLDANERLAKAQQAILKAQQAGAKGVADAQKRAEQAAKSYEKAQTDGAERIADAQRSVRDAQEASANQQRNSARQIADAQEAVAKSQRQLAIAYQSAGVAGGDAYNNMNDALKQLSPAAQAFAQWIIGLKPKLKELRDVAQQGLLPGVQEGMQVLIDRYFPAFKRFVGDIAVGLGAMFSATGMVLSDPRWARFFGFLKQNALPSLKGMWVASLNLARGIANIVQALNPLAKPMGQGLVDLTERFARWSDSLETSSGFQKFLDYARQEGPQVVTLIKDLVVFVGRFVAAAAPIGDTVLKAVTATVEWLNSWDLDTLSGVIEAVAVIGTGIYLLTGFLRTVKFVTETYTAVTLLSAKAQDLLAGAVVRYNAATVGAVGSTGLLNGRLFAMQGAGAAGAAGLSATTAAAGPLGIALAGIAVLWYLNERKMRKADEATDELVDGFKQLGQAYKDTAEGADTSGTLISDTFRDVVGHNQDMQQTVATLTDMGASLDDIAAAANGSSAELKKVMDLIDQRIAQLTKEKNQHFFDIFDNEKRDDEQERLYKIQDRLKEAADQANLASDAMKLLNEQTSHVVDSSARLTPAQKALADAQKVLADSSASAEDQLAALTKVQDLMRQSQIDAIETEEGWESSLDSLTSAVKAAKKAHDEDAASLDIHTEKGRSNRDMLENLITSANKMYDADVALNGITEDAVRKGQDHVAQIREVAKSLGLNRAETEKLIAAYNGIPQDVNTAVNMDKNSFVKVYNDLQRLQWMQQSMKLGLSADEAEAAWKRRDYPKGASGYATGGEITGEGGPREDKQLIWASPGEYVQNFDAVQYYGAGFMDDLNNRRIPRQWLPGFATGGLIPKFAKGGQVATWPFEVNVAKTYLPTLEDLSGGDGQAGTGDLGGTAGAGRGWRWQINTLRKVFPGLALYSGYRPHAVTPSGHLSWHGRDGGRAVDVPPQHNVFNFIHDKYGKGTQELIWLGDKYRNIQHGHHHVYDNALLQQHGTAGMPNAHIHWAYDEGGFLPPGYSTVFNGTGKPEPVLTQPQWDAVVNNNMTDTKPGHTYQFEFRDTSLTPAYLRAIQAREAVLSRAGRAR